MQRREEEEEERGWTRRMKTKRIRRKMEGERGGRSRGRDGGCRRGRIQGGGW